MKRQFLYSIFSFCFCGFGIVSLSCGKVAYEDYKTDDEELNEQLPDYQTPDRTKIKSFPGAYGAGA